MTVLLCAVGLALVSLSMASALMSHYNLAVRSRDSAQADWFARAGVAEFVHRCEQITQNQANIASQPEPILPKFRGQTVLLTPSSHVPATVTLLLDGPRNSRDNSLSPLQAQSSFDSGDRKSIPPFSLDLVLRVEWGGRTFLYEALVQQRWPYAVTAPGPILVCGKCDDPLADQTGLMAASEVRGSILATQVPVAPSQAPLIVFDKEQEELYKMLCPFSNAFQENKVQLSRQQRVNVGGDVETYRFVAKTVEGEEGSQVNIEAVELVLGKALPTSGALLKGDACTYENGEPPVPDSDQLFSIDAKSKMTGQMRPNVRLNGLDPRAPATQAKLRELFLPPPGTGAWKDISSTLAAEYKWKPDEGRLDDVIHRNVTMSDKPGNSTADTLWIQVEGGKARCAKFRCDRLLTLDHCSLACDKDFYVSHETIEREAKGPVLRGENSTLVVGGMLMIDGGEVYAGGNGMVIWADHFLIRASGTYHGAIVSPNGGAFFGQTETATPGLHLRGALLIGGHEILFTGRQRKGENNEDLWGFPIRALGTFTLASTSVQYDPQYLRGLNQFAGYHLQALVRR